MTLTTKLFAKSLPQDLLQPLQALEDWLGTNEVGTDAQFNLPMAQMPW
jgi:hypothetical protein